MYISVQAAWYVHVLADNLHLEYTCAIWIISGLEKIIYARNIDTHVVSISLSRFVLTCAHQWACLECYVDNNLSVSFILPTIVLQSHTSK